MKTVLSILLLALAVYLHSHKLKDYDEDNSIDESYPHTWLVQDTGQDTVSQIIYTSETMDETNK